MILLDTKIIRKKRKNSTEIQNIKINDLVVENDKKQKEKNKQNLNILTEKNIEILLGNSGDLKKREVYINTAKKELKVKLYYIDGLSNTSDISAYVIKPLLEREIFSKCITEKAVLEIIENGGIYFSSLSVTNDVEKAVQEILNGSSVIVFDKITTAVIFDTKKFDKRTVTEPTVENATKGAKDSFIENYRSNTATIRRKIKSKDLVIEEMIIGKQSNTPIGIVYMSNITNEDLINSVKERINKINVDQALTTSILEEYLSDDIKCVFPQVVTTERPDVFCADILEGRVGIIVDGIPFSFIVPGTMVEFMQASEDYSRKSVVATIIRIIRFTSLFIALFLPGMYISITMYHPEMIPTNLATFIARSREGVTFPIPIETILMLCMFEILFEAGLRIPKTVGQAVSIVGTLVVGQAAVEAKLVSPPVVVIVAITIIASFAMPNQDFSNATRIWRMLFTIFSAVFGLIGVVMATILFVYKLCKLESFGVPYLSPFVSVDTRGMFKDSIFRVPYIDNIKRPEELNVKNKVRVGVDNEGKN